MDTKNSITQKFKGVEEVTNQTILRVDCITNKI